MSHSVKNEIYRTFRLLRTIQATCHLRVAGLIGFIALICLPTLPSYADNGLIEPLSEVEISGHYVDIVVQGDFAYAVNEWGLVVLDVSDPDSSPEVINRVPTLGIAVDVAVNDSLLFLCDEYRGLIIYSLDDPENPEETGHFRPNARVTKVTLNGNLAIVGIKSLLGWRDFISVGLFDFSNPAEPELLDSYDPITTLNSYDIYQDYLYIHERDRIRIMDISNPNEIQTVNQWEHNLRSLQTFYIFDSEMYIFGRQGDYDVLSIYSLEDPEEPDSLGSFSEEGNYMQMAEFCIKSGDYLLSSAALGGRGATGYLQIYDISDPANPEMIITVDDWEPLHDWAPRPGGMTVVDDRLYLANGTGVITVFNTSEMENIHFVAQMAEATPLTKIAIGAGHAYCMVEGLTKLIFPHEGGQYYATPVKTYNIENPRSPELTSSLDSLAYKWVDFHFIDRNYLLCTAYGAIEMNFFVLDIDDPSHPQLAAARGRILNRVEGEMVQYGNYLYMRGANGIHIVDMEDPSSPDTVGLFGERPQWNQRGLAIYEEYMYAAGDRNGFCIYSLEHPDNPDSVSFVGLGDSFWSMDIYSDHLYVGSNIYSLEDPENPRWTGDFDSYDRKDGRVISDGIMFIEGGSRKGITAFSLENPEEPEEISNFDTYGCGVDVAVDGDLLCIADTYSMRFCDISRLRVFNEIRLRLSEYSHLFGEVRVDSSAAWELTITNEGRENQQIDSLTLTDRTLYEVFEMSIDAAFELTPQADTTLLIEFIPVEDRMYETQLQIHCGNAVLKVDISGRGVPPGSVSEDEVPIQFGLKGIYPNPFNSTTSISYSLPVPERVTVKIFDLSGRIVAILVDGRLEAGNHRVQWNGLNTPSGVYVCSLEAGSFTKSIKLALLR